MDVLWDFMAQLTIIQPCLLANKACLWTTKTTIFRDHKRPSSHDRRRLDSNQAPHHYSGTTSSGPAACRPKEIQKTYIGKIRCQPWRLCGILYKALHLVNCVTTDTISVVCLFTDYPSILKGQIKSIIEQKSSVILHVTGESDLGSNVT